MDGTTGQVLYHQSGFARNYPASTTKLLTALVALERGRLDQTIRISEKAIAQPPGSSSCYLNPGEQQPLEYLLIGLMLSSGNDCADAIAEGLTNGQPQQFVGWMNQTAKRLGATESNFMNAHGLHHPEHYSTAHDLAIIAKAALEHPVLREIAGTKSFDWPGKNNGTYYNHNAMLFTYEGTVGGKTGFTEQAGLTLVSSAERQGRFLIGVVMGVDSRTNQYNNMTALLDYGFEEFESRLVIETGAPMGNVALENGAKESVGAVAGGSLRVSVKKGTEPALSVTRNLPPTAKTPVAVGDQLGEIIVAQDGRQIGIIPIIAQESVAFREPILARTWDWAVAVGKWVGALFVGLLLFRTVVKTTRRVIRNRRRRTAGRTRRPAARGDDLPAYRIRHR